MDEKMKLDFEKYAKRHIFFDENIGISIKEIIEGMLKEKKGLNVLDIGAGDGNLVLNLKKRYPQVNISVSDISENRINRIKGKLRSELKHYYIDDICNSKIPAGSFDFVNSDQVIEHVPSDKKMVEEIKRILKKGGYFRVSSVYKKKWAWYFYRCNGKWVLDPTHIREYTSIDSFKKLFLNEGLIILDLKINPTYFPIVDLFLRIFQINDQTKLICKLRKIKIRILGYYHIEITGVKK